MPFYYFGVFCGFLHNIVPLRCLLNAEIYFRSGWTLAEAEAEADRIDDDEAEKKDCGYWC